MLLIIKNLYKSFVNEARITKNCTFPILSILFQDVIFIPVVLYNNIRFIGGK